MNVVSIAALFWASFNLFAIVALSRVILTRSSSPLVALAEEGTEGKPMDSNKSPFKILPSLPDPLIVLISILFSSTILFTAGDNISFLIVGTSVIFGFTGSGALTGSFLATFAVPAPTVPKTAPTLTVVPA